MGILDAWRAARGSVLRKEYEDAIGRMRGSSDDDTVSFMRTLFHTSENLAKGFDAASPAERKAFLKQMRQAATEMWDGGDRPASLGLAVACINAESSIVPGDDAALVKLDSDRLIRKAAEFSEKI